MIVNLNEEEITTLKVLIDHHMAWAMYKTKNIKMPDEETSRLLKDIDILTLLVEKFS